VPKKRFRPRTLTVFSGSSRTAVSRRARSASSSRACPKRCVLRSRKPWTTDRRCSVPRSTVRRGPPPFLFPSKPPPKKMPSRSRASPKSPPPPCAWGPTPPCSRQSSKISDRAAARK